MLVEDEIRTTKTSHLTKCNNCKYNKQISKYGITCGGASRFMCTCKLLKHGFVFDINDKYPPCLQLFNQLDVKLGLRPDYFNEYGGK